MYRKIKFNRKKSNNIVTRYVSNSSLITQLYKLSKLFFDHIPEIKVLLEQNKYASLQNFSDCETNNSIKNVETVNSDQLFNLNTNLKFREEEIVALKSHKQNLTDENEKAIESFKVSLSSKESEINNLTKNYNDLQRKYDLLYSQIDSLKCSNNELIAKNNDLNLLNKKISEELEYFKESYSGLNKIYTRYCSLSSHHHSALQGIFGKSEAPEVFLCGALQDKNLVSLYEYISQALNNKQLSEQEISILTEVFDFSFNVVNKSCRDPLYRRLEVKVGIYFDEKSMRKTSSSVQLGKVKNILLQGFAHAVSNRIVCKSLIELGM